MLKVCLPLTSLPLSSHSDPFLPSTGDYLKWRVFHTPPFWSEAPISLEREEQPSSIPSSLRGDYTPAGQMAEHSLVPPGCLLYLLVEFVLVLFMVVLNKSNVLYVTPLIALIPLVATIYIFNFRGFRKWKFSHAYWIAVQFTGSSCIPQSVTPL